MILPRVSHRALYAAFDRYPSSRGAALHISKLAGALFDTLDGGVLFALGAPELPEYQLEDRVEILRFIQPIPHYLERALAFSAQLERVLETQLETLELGQFRDPWSGMALVSNPRRRYKTIYEINGLPSIELPTRYTRLEPRTLERIRALERFCWDRADLILTPSPVMRDNLIALGAPAPRIEVHPNGAELLETPPRPLDAPSNYLLYFGAVQPWQGVDVLLRAFATLRDWPTLKLVICSAVPQARSQRLLELAERLELGDRVLWHFELDQPTLLAWKAHAMLSVTPLTECARNLEQGCCPLKILESMAVGVPVVASDLPVTRALIDEGVNGRLVRPDRPLELARALRILLEHAPERLRMGARAREKIAAHYTWPHLLECYRASVHRLLEADSATSSSRGVLC